MTWAEFNAAVRVYLPSHDRRHGIQPLIDALIVAGLKDVMSAVPALRAEVRRVYLPGRFISDGFAGRATYPIGAVLRAVYARNPDDHSQTFEFRTAESEAERVAMIEGLTEKTARWLNLDPKRGYLRVVPNPVEDGSEIVVVYDSRDIEFEDDDDVPFDDEMVSTVADFVLSRLSRTVDSDAQAAESFNATFIAQKRALLFREAELRKQPHRSK